MTFVGTVGVCAGALIFFPTGELLIGVLFITAFVFSDLIDGKMARELGRSSKFGAFWDSTLDRFGDGAIFGGLALYFAGAGRLLPLPLRLALLPGHGLGHLLRPGPRRVAGHGRQGRDRRAGRPAGRRSW